MSAPGLPGELAILYDRHVRSCLALARRVLGDVGRAESAVCDAFLDAWQHLTTAGALPRPAEGWLARRTHGHAVARLRAGRSALPAVAAVDGAATRPGAPVVGGTCVLGWTVWDGCTAQDIAAMTGAPVAHVRADLLAGVRDLTRRAESARADGPDPDHPR